MLIQAQVLARCHQIKGCNKKKRKKLSRSEYALTKYTEPE